MSRTPHPTPTAPSVALLASPETCTGRGGYRTHQIGKWDAGTATPDHTPKGQGHDTSLGYFHHDSGYWDETAGRCCVKLEDAGCHSQGGAAGTG